MHPDRNSILPLQNPPIVEAVVDVDCDLPAGFELAALEEPAKALFKDMYPKPRTQFLQEFRMDAMPGAALNASTRRAVQAFQFLHEDEKQLVQVRGQGFSFNRLAPYSSLDDYLPEIERTWRLYAGLVSPVQIRVIRLRYINRILLPMQGGKVDLEDYLTVGPRLADEENFMLSSFLSQQDTVEKSTGHQVNMVLASQAPTNEKLPLILDITVASPVNAESTAWSNIEPFVKALRNLKNKVFLNTLAPKCIQLFQS